MSSAYNNRSNDDNLEQLARKRVGARLGWYIHATVYVIVNLALITASFSSGRHWAIFPALGWGLGLVMHGLVVWLAMPGGSLHERLIQKERARLVSQRDPW